MSERALGGDERGVVGSAGPEQALGREIGLCCCAEAAERCSGSLALCGCPAELIFQDILGAFSWANTGLFLHDQLRAIWAFWCYLRVSLPSLLPQGFAGGGSVSGCCLTRLMLGKPTLDFYGCPLDLPLPWLNGKESSSPQGIGLDLNGTDEANRGFVWRGHGTRPGSEGSFRVAGQGRAKAGHVGAVHSRHPFGNLIL